MRIRIRPAWFALLLVPTAMECGSGNEIGMRYGPAELDHHNIALRVVTGTVLCESQELGLPIDLVAVGPFLGVLDLASDSVLHVIDAATGVHLAQLGRRGDGPGEFQAAWSLDGVPGDSNMVWVYDIGRRRLAQFDVARSVQQMQLSATRSLTLTSDAVPTGPLWLSPDTLATLGFFLDGRIGIFDGDGGQIASVGALPSDAKVADLTIRQQAYRATLVERPSGSLIAAVTRHASLVDIYATNGEHLVQIEGPLRVRPRFRVGRGRRGPALQTGPDLRFGYVDATATDDHIYALFSGRTREGFPRSAFQGRFIHVFDWKGNFERAVEVDSDLIRIDMDPSGELMYGLRYDPTPAVLRFSLSADSWSQGASSR